MCIGYMHIQYHLLWGSWTSMEFVSMGKQGSGTVTWGKEGLLCLIKHRSFMANYHFLMSSKHTKKWLKRTWGKPMYFGLHFAYVVRKSLKYFPTHLLIQELFSHRWWFWGLGIRNERWWGRMFSILAESWLAPQ